MSDSVDTLDIVQQVLRGMLVSLAMSQRADMQLCSSSLKAFAEDGNLDPMAKVMLNDLARGMDLLSQTMPKPQ